MSSVVIFQSILTAVIRHDIMPINQQNDRKVCNSCISLKQSLEAHTLFAGLLMSLPLEQGNIVEFFVFLAEESISRVWKQVGELLERKQIKPPTLRDRFCICRSYDPA